MNLEFSRHIFKKKLLRNFLNILRVLSGFVPCGRMDICFGNMICALYYAFLPMFCLELLRDINIKHSVERAKVKGKVKLK
jgi:hypothetical protein